jgi:hypothetical protein
MRRGQASIAVLGALIALSLIMFPEWQVVHPTNPPQTETLGIAWVGSPPTPPRGFEQKDVMQTPHSDIGAVIVLLVTGALMLMARADD